MMRLYNAILFTASLMLSSTCIHGSTDEESFKQQLLDRIEALENKDTEQTMVIRAQGELMKKIESKLDDQAEKLQGQDVTIRDYKERLGMLEDTVTRLQKDKVARLQKYTVARLQKDNPSQLPDHHGVDRVDRKEGGYNNVIGSGSPRIRREKEGKSRALVNAEGPVAFHAVIKAGGPTTHIGKNQNIVFPDVLTNIGGGFHSLHGVFIAPVPGIYIFSTSILSYSGATQHTILVHLMKNGQVLANAMGNGATSHNDQGSVTVVTRLAVGDEVWVSLYNPADASTWGDSFDSFTGCLVTPEYV